jgi:hypothetical protein
MSNPSTDKTKSGVFRTIERRLQELNPPIELQKHIASDLEVAKNTLDGVKFLVKSRKAILDNLRASKDSIGQKAFAEGSKIDPKHWDREGIKGDPDHWALNLSFGATDGIGFREIWRYRLTTRSLRMADARPPGLNVGKLDGRFAGNFGDNPSLPDISSLHLAVWDEKVNNKVKTYCTAHIDEAGFVIEGPGGAIMLTPDFLRHTGVELVWKTMLRGKIPDWMVDRFNPILPSSFNDYSRAGLSIDLVKGETYKVSVTGSCGIFGGFECSGTVGISGTFNWLGSK